MTRPPAVGHGRELPRIGDRAAERVAAIVEARNEHAVAMLAEPDAWARLDLPGWVRERFPGIDLAAPETMPEPGRCAEGRPWGADPYGMTGVTLDERWRRYVEAPRSFRPCRNRWRDRATLLCGTHLAAWQRTREEAERRIGRERRWHEHTELARQLGVLGVVAEAGTAGVVLRPDDARQLIELLRELSGDRAQLIDTGVEQAAADRDALLDLLGAVGDLLRQPADGTPRGGLAAARDRARRHLDRTTPTPATPTE